MYNVFAYSLHEFVLCNWQGVKSGSGRERERGGESIALVKRRNNKFKFNCFRDGGAAFLFSFVALIAPHTHTDTERHNLAGSWFIDITDNVSALLPNLFLLSNFVNFYPFVDFLLLLPVCLPPHAPSHPHTD